MDLVFKRYSNPYFLDLCIENNDLDNFVVTFLKQIDDDKLWELYLATAQFNDKDFTAWKKEIIKSKTPSRKMTKKEIDTTIKKSQNILKNFKPPEKGGRL